MPPKGSARTLVYRPKLTCNASDYDYSYKCGQCDPLNSADKWNKLKEDNYASQLENIWDLDLIPRKPMHSVYIHLCVKL